MRWWEVWMVCHVGIWLMRTLPLRGIEIGVVLLLLLRLLLCVYSD